MSPEDELMPANAEKSFNQIPHKFLGRGWGLGGDAEPLTLKPVYWMSSVQQETIKYSKSLD